MAQAPEPLHLPFYASFLRCQLTTGTFICYTEEAVFHVGLVTEVRPAEGMLVVQRFVDESFILCSTFETDDFSIIPDHKMNMLIETNIIIVISISSVAGLTFVLSDGSRTLLVPCDGRLRDVYLVYSSFNSNTKVVFHGSHFFHPFPSQAFPNLLSD